MNRISQIEESVSLVMAHRSPVHEIETVFVQFLLYLSDVGDPLSFTSVLALINSLLRQYPQQRKLIEWRKKKLPLLQTKGEYDVDHQNRLCQQWGFRGFSIDKTHTYILRDLNTTYFCIQNCPQLDFFAIFKYPNNYKIEYF